MGLLDALRRLLGGGEEDPLRREVEEARRLAKSSVRACERVERHLRRKHGGPLGKSKPEERAGLLRAAEELGEVFPEELQKP